ncbi:MAG: sigma-70 family RNA polymerase sigma factor [Saprospiraceae bacterium]|nr:sigma-70 family RNA polymerase sigma factor [Saprospiraceae bacterium]
MNLKLSQALEKVRNSEKSRSSLVTDLFNDRNLRALVSNMIVNNKGFSEDVDLIYNEMIIQFIKTLISKNELQQDGPVDPYLLSIAKYLWFAELKKRHKYSDLSQEHETSIPDVSPTLEKLFVTKENYGLLHTILDRLRSRCKEVLLYWANGFSMEDIAIKLSYQSEGMARKKKSQCFKELLTFLSDNPQIKSQLAYD